MTHRHLAKQHHLGALPDPEWRRVLAHCLARADSFVVHIPDGDGPFGSGRDEVTALPGAEVRPWSGMRDCAEISGPLTPEARALFISIETSLTEFDEDRKLWDYQLLLGGTVLLHIGDRNVLVIDESDVAALRQEGVLDSDERPS